MKSSFFLKWVDPATLSASLLASIAFGWAWWRYQPFRHWTPSGPVTDNPVDWLGI